MRSIADARYLAIHLLPVLLGNRGHGVVANPQCAGDCPLGVTSGECVDDALSNGEWAKLCVMALWVGISLAVIWLGYVQTNRLS